MGFNSTISNQERKTLLAHSETLCSKRSTKHIVLSVLKSQGSRKVSFAYMYRPLLVFCALLCCGFTVVTDSMLKDREKLCKRIRSTYGESTLTAFVREITSSHPIVDEVRLDSSKVGDKWLTMDWNPFWHVISGDWALKVNSERRRDKGFSEFTLFWACDEGHGIFVEGVREKSGVLKLISIRREETVALNWH